MPTINETFTDLFYTLRAQLRVTPLNLGGFTSISGGFGGPPGGFLGYLPQTRVAGDLEEIAFSGILSSGTTTLYDNLNHIRYRLGILESGGVSTNLILEEGGVVISSGVTVINFEGAEVVEVSPGNVTITITTSGTGDVSGPSSVVDENVVIFDGTTGKLIKDSTHSLSEYSLTGHTHVEADITDLDHNAVKLQGQDISGAIPVSGEVLTYDGNAWYPGASSGGGGHTIQDEGTPLTQRTNLNFVGTTVEVTDDAVNDATIVTITPGAGGGDVVGPDSATDGNIVTFSGATGKSIGDSGYTIADFSLDGHTHSHTTLTNIGTNTHALIDTHIADSNLHEAIGFEENPAITLTFNDSTLEFSVAPSGVASFDYYFDGEKRTKVGAQTITISGTGLHFIYYDVDDILKTSLTTWDIQNTVQVATVYWNGTSSIIGNELHGLQMDRKTHEYLHETVGTRYASGLAGSFTDSTITIGSGEWYDEDMEYITLGNVSVVRVLYREGSVWKWTALQTKYYYEVSNILQYNNGTALADVNNNRFVAYWIYATNHTDTPFISIMGQREDTSIIDARNNNKPENLVFGTLPLAEMKLLYRVIVKRSGTSEVYQEATDYRTVSPVPTSNYVSTDHGSLTGLQDQDHSAEAIYTVVTAFNGKLSASDDDVQKALNTLDNHTHTESEITDLSHDAIKLQGITISDAAPSFGQSLVYNGSSWSPATVSGTTIGSGVQSLESDLVWYVDGEITVYSGAQQAFIATAPGTIRKIYAYLKDTGESGSTVIDVNKNGTTIFTTQANRPTIVYDNTTGLATGTPNITSLVEYDIITIDIDAAAEHANGLTIVMAFTFASANATDILQVQVFS